MVKRVLPYAWPILILLPLLLVAKWSDSWGTLIILGAAITAAGEFVLPLEKDSARHVWSRRIVLSGVVLTIVAGFLDNSAKNREQRELAAKVEEDLVLAKENTALARAQTEKQESVARSVAENVEQAKSLALKQEEALNFLSGGKSTFYFRFSGDRYLDEDAAPNAHFAIEGTYPVPHVDYNIGLLQALKDGRNAPRASVSSAGASIGPIPPISQSYDKLEFVPDCDSLVCGAFITQGMRALVQIAIGEKRDDKFHFMWRVFEIKPSESESNPTLKHLEEMSFVDEALVGSQIAQRFDDFAERADGNSMEGLKAVETFFPLTLVIPIGDADEK